jgi:hypothetical protein
MRFKARGIGFPQPQRRFFRSGCRKELIMLRKTLIGALVLALTPALAFAAPTTMTARPVAAKPAITHTVKLKKTAVVKPMKAEKIRLILKHRAVKKMRVVAHLKTHRPLTHKI